MSKRAAALRRQATQPERALWYWLRNRRLVQLKFRRQATIDRFIVDFLCPELRLVVEIDGESHVGRGERDRARDGWLEDNGYHVVRVTNDDVLRNIEGVVLVIQRAAAGIRADVESIAPPTPLPPPSREGEK